MSHRRRTAVSPPLFAVVAWAILALAPQCLADDILPRIDASGVSTTRCGLNSTYMFLGLFGVAADFDALALELTHSGPGSNLADMAKVIRDRGLDVAIYKVNLREIPPELFPCIAHIPPTAPRFPDGHFYVLLNQGPKGVLFADGTYPLRGGWATQEQLDALCDGYILCRRPLVGSSQALLWPAACSTLAIVLLLLTTPRRRSDAHWAAGARR